MRYILIITVILLSACQPVSIKKDNFYFQVSKDASIEITQQLLVPANSARAYFQNGELLTHTGIDLYKVNCEVLINTVSELQQIIKPGLFKIISIILDESPIVMRKPFMVASLNSSSRYYAFEDSDNSPPDIKRFYKFILSPQNHAQETQVRSLTCRGVQEQPHIAEPPTVSEMQAAVGDYVVFNL